MKRDRFPLLVAAAAAALVIAMPRRRNEDALAPVRDMSRLEPLFRQAVERVLAAMRARGFKPMVWETYRSPERSVELVRRGTGKLGSVHRLGLGVDIVEDDQTPWSTAPGFLDALAEEAERENLVSGWRWQSRDGWHVQALPVRYDSQISSMTAAQRSALVRRYLLGPKGHALALKEHVERGGELGTRGKPSAFVREAQAGMRELVADGIFGDKTDARALALGVAIKRGDRGSANT